uniref:WD repeat-containing protein 55 homolog n=1 Tax=Daphnia galeata TaxID=27404 RepID=A0A8J2R7S2_9CRUS|nr:unnamed protein product [Daphnia galeata]
MAESKEYQELSESFAVLSVYADDVQPKDTECGIKKEGIKLQFKKSIRSVSKINNHPRSINRFHPTLAVLACGVNREVILLSAADGCIPFEDWKESQVKLQKRPTSDDEFTYFAAIEWNVQGTQLAVGDDNGGLIVWSYPKGEILFQAKEHTAYSVVGDIQWNPFRHDVLSTWNPNEKKLLLWRSSSDTNLFDVFEYEVKIKGVVWISENQIALALQTGLIEIFKIDGSQPKTGTRIVMRLQHETNSYMTGGILWSEKTKYLATCSRDGWIKIWSLAKDQPIYSLKCHSGCWIGCFAKTDNGSAFGLEDGSIAIWSPLGKTEQSRHRILSICAENDVIVDSLSFSQDGRLLASLVRDNDGNQLITWSAQTWMPVFINRIHLYHPYWLSWLNMESSADPCYKISVPQHVNRQNEVTYVYLNSSKAETKNGLQKYLGLIIFLMKNAIVRLN